MNPNGEIQSDEVGRRSTLYSDLKRWLGLIVLLISAALLVWTLKSILLLFAVVFLLAMVLNPMVAALQKRGVHRGIGVALLVLAFAAVFALALYFLIPPLLTQFDELIRQTPAGLETSARPGTALGPALSFDSGGHAGSGQGFGHCRSAGR